MKYVNLTVVILFLSLTGLGTWTASQNMYIDQIVDGGYLYKEDKVIGTWDRWERIDAPVWCLPLYAVPYVLFGSPLWFQLLYFPATLWVAVTYILPRVLTVRRCT